MTMGMSGWIKVGSMYGVWDGKMDGSIHILFSQFCIGFFVFSFFLRRMTPKVLTTR